ncbi:MAG: transcription antitermination factor NusB [Clostridia bacterium]
MSRRKSREAALKLLYSWDIGVKNPKNSVDKVIDLLKLNNEEIVYMVELYDRVINNISGYDVKIESHLKQWRLDRLAVIERNILRLAAAELDPVANMPKQVVINEAVELAKLYCDSNAYRLINGVLANLEMDE